MSFEKWRALIESAVAFDLPYYDHPLPTTGLEAAVLIPIAFETGQPQPYFLLTKRTDRVEKHKGQVAFPGGVRDPEDESLIDTALRETFEEVGIYRDQIEVVGTLPPLWTRTGFLVTPVIGIIKDDVKNLTFKTSVEEIDELFWVDYATLSDPKVYTSEPFVIGDRTYPIHSFAVSPHRIWGVTGSIVRNFIERLQAVELNTR